MVEKPRGEEPGRREKAGARLQERDDKDRGGEKERGGKKRKKFPCIRAVIISTRNCRVHNYNAQIAIHASHRWDHGQLRDKC